MPRRLQNPETYHDLNPEDIAHDINQSFSESEQKQIYIMNKKFIVLPHVYPSHRFRSTNTMLETILKHTSGKSICEIGCGCGTLGQIALLEGASKLVQGDINPHAVKNALVNKQLHNFSDTQLSIYESDCFDCIPSEIFDVIIFAMPYHSDDIEIKDPLLTAFYDPNFASIRKFVTDAHKFMHNSSDIFIAFSNKGDTKSLESVFDKSKFSWELFTITNQEATYDNRVYRLFLS